MPAHPPDGIACRDHPARTAVARCGVCGRRLCDDCYRFRLDARAACARCAYEAATRPARRASLAAAFLCITLGGGVFAARRYDLWDEAAGWLVLGGVLAVVIAVVIGMSGRDEAPPALENRDPADEPSEAAEEPPPAGAHPYRARVRRAVLAASPRLSGRATALVVVASLAASAVLLPASLKLPRWVEAELVLGAWWLIVAGVLVTLLYRGFRLRDDFVYFAPWNRPAADPDAPATSKGSGGGLGGLEGCSGLDGCSGVDAEGCAFVVVAAVAFAAAFGAAWVLVEFAMPLAFFLMYWLFMRAIGRVANDRHGCAGSLARSAGWGALWATAYVLPVAALAWAAHAFTLAR